MRQPWSHGTCNSSGIYELLSVSVVLWKFQAFSPSKKRYSWACVCGWRPLPGVRRLKCPLSAGHISDFADGNVNIFVISRSKVQGDANSIKHECSHVYMYMVYMYFRRKIEAVPAYYTDVTTVAQNTSILDNACEGRA